jgi:hypothetical protein
VALKIEASENRDEAWRIAVNIAKLPQGAAAEATGLYRPHFRYDLNSRHFAGLRSLTSWATSGLMQCSNQQPYSITSSASLRGYSGRSF